MLITQNKIFASRDPIKYFESAPPELGRSDDGKRTIFQVQPYKNNSCGCNCRTSDIQFRLLNYGKNVEVIQFYQI